MIGVERGAVRLPGGVRVGARGLALPGASVIFTLRDEFSIDRAAGSVHGTANDPDGNTTRTVTDTGSKLSLHDGYADFAVGVTYGNPGLWLDLAVVRALGKTVTAKVMPTNTGNMMFGLDPAKSSTINGNSFWFSGGKLYTYNAATQILISPSLTLGADYDVTIVLRAAGSLMFVRGPEYPMQTLVYVSALGNTATQYLSVIGGTGAGRCYYLRNPETLAFPSPLASEGFGSTFGTTDGLGHSEGLAGGLGVGGGSVSWTQQAGTFANGSGVCAASALSGGVGIATLTADANVQLQVTPTRAGGMVGLVLRYVNINNHLRVEHDGTNCALIKRIGGTDTTILTAATTLAGLQVFADGENVGLWCGNTNIGFGTIPEAILQTSTLCGLYTTNMGNTFNDFVAWSRT